MFLPPLLVVVLLEAAAAKAVNPVALLLVEGAISIVGYSVARPRELLQQEEVMTMAAGCRIRVPARILL